MFEVEGAAQWWGERVENRRHREKSPMARERGRVKLKGITNVTKPRGWKWNWIQGMM